MRFAVLALALSLTPAATAQVYLVQSHPVYTPPAYTVSYAQPVYFPIQQPTVYFSPIEYTSVQPSRIVIVIVESSSRPETRPASYLDIPIRYP